MKSTSKPTILLTFYLLSVLIIGCSGQIEKQTEQLNKIEDVETDKEDYELADEFLDKLKTDKADTIIFYKRTCISCCDFFNIFWSLKGQRHLTKFYFDFDDMKTHSKTIPLTNAKIFTILSNNYAELKNTTIKENLHKNKDGSSTLTINAHYCYAQMMIYSNQDSIITDRMKDHDFDKYTNFDFEYPDEKEKRETNDNYTENLNSKWNILLTTIENEISIMPETDKRELETLRTRKNNN